MLIIPIPYTPLFASECEPGMDEATIAQLINERNGSALVEQLLANARPSDLFVENQGTDGLEKAIQKMVNQLFEGRSVESAPIVDDELTNVAAKFREGILAACETLAAGKSDEEAAAGAVKAASLSGGDSFYYFLLGAANSLEADGRFTSGLEASLMSVTNFPGMRLGIHHIPLIGNVYKKAPNKPVAGSFEITFSEIGSIDESEEGMTDSTNPFAAGGGFFRLNTGLDTYFSGGDAISGLGLRLGGGFSTQPSEAGDDVDTRARGYAGMVFRANYGQDDRGRQGKGEVFIGYAKDKFWKYETVIDDTTMPPTTMLVNETDRFVVEARMDVPQVFASEDVRLHARIFADLPASGDGPSDIRISLLLTVNLGAIFPIN
jgi:hypothetical protein